MSLVLLWIKGVREIFKIALKSPKTLTFGRTRGVVATSGFFGNFEKVIYSMMLNLSVAVH